MDIKLLPGMDNNEQENEARITARGFLIFAKEYLDAYDAILLTYPKINDLFNVKMFTVCHALELIIKSFLREEALSVNDIKKIGHSLKNLKKQLLKSKFKYVLDSFDEEIIDFADYHYSQKDFEYHKIGYKSVPDMNQIKTTVTKLIKEAEESIDRPRGYISI